MVPVLSSLYTDQIQHTLSWNAASGALKRSDSHCNVTGIGLKSDTKYSCKMSQERYSVTQSIVPAVALNSKTTTQKVNVLLVAIAWKRNK